MFIEEDWDEEVEVGVRETSSIFFMLIGELKNAGAININFLASTFLLFLENPLYLVVEISKLVSRICK